MAGPPQAVQTAASSVASSANELIIWGVTAGDWLQALSGVVGIAMTVLVTLWIEGRRRLSEERADLRIVDRAVRDIQNALDACEVPLPAAQDLQARLALASAAQKKLYEALPGYEFARTQTVIRDLNVFRDLRHLDGALQSVTAQIGSEYSILLGGAGPVTEPVLRVNQTKIGDIVTHLRPFTEAAAAALAAKL